MALAKQEISPERGTHAKIVAYSEAPVPFGVASATEKAPAAATPSPSKSPARKKKLCIDHLGVDTPSEAMLREMFDYFDSTGSGALDLKEFREIYRESFDNYGVPLTDRDVDRLFEKFDKVGAAPGSGANGDGKLRFPEFSVLILHRLGQ